MNEISVVVSQEPGKVTWNFEEIKKSLEDSVAVYQGMVYTDDTIKTAKSDVAELRALAKAIEDRRKEVKEKCLEPYNIIEKQAKELVALVNKPIEAINIQVQDYESRRKEAVRAKIDAYWKQKCVALPENIWEAAHSKIYDSRWENATATQKSWKDGIDNGVAEIQGAIETIKSFSSEFEEDMLNSFYTDLSLQNAIQKMNSLKAQKERILEMERQKKEREARLAEQQAQEQAQPVASVSQPASTQDLRQANMSQNAEPKNENIPQPVNKPEMVQEKPGIVLRIVGSEQQLAKIKDYIKFTGASWEEV